jgi:hypothetical protein
MAVNSFKNLFDMLSTCLEKIFEAGQGQLLSTKICFDIPTAGGGRGAPVCLI